MSSGTLTQLIASGGGGGMQPEPTGPTTASTPIVTYVCLNDTCWVNHPAVMGSLPAFATLQECQKVCGVKPSTQRPQ